tara:strand:- start:3302 stop:3544 length:243 start_codon:yes stop_codon:yes gene_type:complete
MTYNTILVVEKGDNRGLYYAETENAYIFLPMHETIEDIYKTITHETFHHCFEKAEETENMDERMEEALIYNLQWAEESLV